MANNNTFSWSSTASLILPLVNFYPQDSTPSRNVTQFTWTRWENEMRRAPKAMSHESLTACAKCLKRQMRGMGPLVAAPHKLRAAVLRRLTSEVDTHPINQTN
ncbi:hypothetical protein AJ79_02954 [Helicocarpus griseus UAMH5409]|uniref:Uncharacterized protein n=1 Tax=Helicocarpus griseus UAMH5409 TaxID=1447875 RepID=A0A2B7Y0C5_9EURO|nr:hypothetical protein AJ79_02954 [Helicocarpus griseus UAMH5409]